MKRYIDMVTGLLILMVVVSPIIKLIQKDINMDSEILTKPIQQIKVAHKEDPKLLELQGKQAKDVFIAIMEEEIKELLKESTDYAIDKINISICEDEANFGEIKDIEIILKDIRKEEKLKEDLILVGQIEEVRIGNGIEKSMELEELKDNEEIIMSIYENFNIPKNNIKVFLYKEGEKDG